MQLLSMRWGVSFGQFTLMGTLTPDLLEKVFATSADMAAMPAHPEAELKLAAPCSLYDPNLPPTPISFLDRDGNTWIGVGTRVVSNTPNPALVEALFRHKAHAEFGDEWTKGKGIKKRLARMRKEARLELAIQTPFRMSEAGALFVCLSSGALVSIGHGGITIAKDMVGRAKELHRVAFRLVDKTNQQKALAILQQQDADITPWPTGTAALRRRRGDVTETCSVRRLKWSKDSQDAADLLLTNWKPEKIELQFADSSVCAADLTGGIASMRWTGTIRDADPSPVIEARLSSLLVKDAAVRDLFVKATGDQPLPMEG